MKVLILSLSFIIIVYCIGSSTLTDRKLEKIVCVTDRTCEAYQEKSWLGEQRHEVIKDLVYEQGFGKDHLPESIQVHEFQINNIRVLNVNATWTGFSHFQNRSAYRLLDVKKQKQVELIQLIKPDKLEPLKQVISHKFLKYIDENRQQGWLSTPQSDEEAQSWLDRNINNIITHYGTLEKIDDIAFLTFCTDNAPQHNAFYGCVSIPAENYLKADYV